MVTALFCVIFPVVGVAAVTGGVGYGIGALVDTIKGEQYVRIIMYFKWCWGSSNLWWNLLRYCYRSRSHSRRCKRGIEKCCQELLQ